MTEAFSPGDRVRTASADPAHHTRLPRYARGATGTVVELLGRHPLPDLRSRSLPAEPEPVYTVAFAARDLFGAGDHAVSVDLWHSYLRSAEAKEDRAEADRAGENRAEADR